MANVAVLTDTDEPVAYARRLNHSLGIGSLRAEPWIEIDGLTLTQKGEQLYGSAIRLHVGTTLILSCEDGLCFVGCTAGNFGGSSAPITFLAMDVLDAKGNSFLG
jgi:hypothetical protein